MAQYLSSKPRYEILDGLRGVAALLVLAFHLFETYSPGVPYQIINHGYLAVDFFFVLSGFVIGYAYDDRWGTKMTLKDFFKRRIIRLHPMLVMGSLIGLLLFYFGGCEEHLLVSQTSPWVLLGMFVLSALLIPATASMDIRGWEETYPLNGAAWSLMLEYVANILYAFVFRFLPKAALAVLVAIFACFTTMLCFHYAPFGIELPDYCAYTVIGGWGIWGSQLWIAVVRLAYPFFCGLLISRIGRFINVKNGFWLCALIVACCQIMPRVGGDNPDNFWMNGLYEAVCILLVFPLVVTIGAGSTVSGRRSSAICRWLGEISYPLYITHYPLIYVQMNWCYQHPDATVEQQVMMSASIFIIAVLMAWAALKLYDEPVRDWLKRKWAS